MNLVRTQVSGRAAAEVQRINFVRFVRPCNFNLDRSQVVLNQNVTAGEKREIAITTSMPAERHMHVSGAWRCSRRGRMWQIGMCERVLHVSILRMPRSACYDGLRNRLMNRLYHGLCSSHSMPSKYWLEHNFLDRHASQY